MTVDQERPWTTADLVGDLQRLGIDSGMVLMVHTSLRSIGFVAGGPEAVIDALRAAIGLTGTLTMPAHTADRSDPAEWVAPPVPEHWWPTIRDHMPPFDPYRTPPQQMGALATALLLRRDTLRSTHPQLSHMASGPEAGYVIAPHDLDEGFGDESPLGRLYELDATVVLLGVDHANNTSLHLAEVRGSWPSKRRAQQGSRVLVDGRSQWVVYEQTDYDSDDFRAVGAAFEASSPSAGTVRIGRFGSAVAKVMRMRDLVDFATTWFSTHRV
jgi:aminoglycoside 3-N-acetyltransferase